MTPEAFRARLAALGLSLAQFAALTGVHRSTVSWWGKVRDGAVAEFPLWVDLMISGWESYAGLLEIAKLMVAFLEDAPTLDYNEDRTLSWITFTATQARKAIARVPGVPHVESKPRGRPKKIIHHS